MDIQQYADIGEKQEAAFLTHKRQYELMKPFPVQPTRQARRDWFMRLALMVMIFAGMAVSGSRTITIFAIGKNIAIGGAAVVMLEGAAVVMSFYHTREKYRNREVDSAYITRYLRFGSLFAVLVMCSGNVQDILAIDGFNNGTLWIVLSFPIAISVALSAPIMVFISGHVLAMLSVQDMSADRRAELDYEAQVTTWNDSMIQAWQRSRLRQTVQVSVEPVNSVNGSVNSPALPVHSVRSVNGSVNENGERIDIGSIIQGFFTAHPERINDKLDILVQDIRQESGIEVGRTSIHNVRREMKGKVS